ncbi:MAG: DUF427 domain-containing protein [Pseudomonadota bacterium]
MAKDAIHNPKEPRHFMRLKPVPGCVRVWLGDRMIAESKSALRLLEIGRDLYDPVFYLPPEDLNVSLSAHTKKQTHCPLKGDASYYTLPELKLGEDEYLAWTYASPLDLATEIAGLYAFNHKLVRIEEIGTSA